MNKKHFSICKADIKAKRPEGIIPFILTSLTVDRDSEVVLPSGVKTENFVKNPVFLWAHDSFAPPIGKVLPETITTTSEKMTADVQFDLTDKFAKMIYNKYKSGYLNAASIRFMPLKSGKPILEGQKWDTWIESELLELSAVPIPSNPEALAQKGFDDNDDKNFIELVKRYLSEYDQEGDWKSVLEKFYGDEETENGNDDEEKQVSGNEELVKEADDSGNGDNDLPSSDSTSADVPAEGSVSIEDQIKILNKRLDDLYELIVNPYMKDAMVWLNDFNISEWEGSADAMNALIDEKNLGIEVKDKIFDILRKQYLKFDKTPPERSVCIASSIDDISEQGLLKLLKEGDGELYSQLVKTVADLLTSSN